LTSGKFSHQVIKTTKQTAAEPIAYAGKSFELETPRFVLAVFRGTDEMLLLLRGDF